MDRLLPYYLGTSYAISDDQRVELYILVLHKDMDRTYTNRTYYLLSRVMVSIDGYNDSAFVEERSLSTE